MATTDSIVTHLKAKFPDPIISQIFLENKISNIFPQRIKSKICLLSCPNFDDYPQSGSLYLWGDFGVGKTILGAFLLLHRIKRISDFHKMLFINTTELLFLFKQSYTKQIEESESEIMDKYSKADLLILDDIGVEKTTDWAYQMLYILVNRRYERMLPTIFTSNYDLNSLAEKMKDGRIASRIQEMCEGGIFQLLGKSFRE